MYPFFTDFSNSKNFFKCFDLSGGQKCPNNGLVSLKKYVVFSLDWEGGGQMQCNKCYIFFIFLFEGFPNLSVAFNLLISFSGLSQIALGSLSGLSLWTDKALNTLSCIPCAALLFMLKSLKLLTLVIFSR